jgi:hypothetical protein
LCRNRFLHVGLAFAEAPVEHFGLDRAGRDTVDADALLGKFQRSRLGEADDGKLAGDVNRCAGKADVPADGGIIDDGTTTGPNYGRDFVLHRQQHATDIDVADLMVVLYRLLGGEQTELALGAGVVERDVQSAEGADGLFDERHDVILPGDIGLYEQGVSTGRSDLPGDLLSLGNPAAGDDHNRAFVGKRQGSGFADAGGASGDEDSLVLEGFHSWPQRRIGRFGTRIVFNLEIQNLDKGVVLATSLIQQVRKERIVLPPVAVLERICAQAITRANRIIFNSLTKCLDCDHRRQLDNLLYQRVDPNATKLAWLRQPPGIPNARHLLEHIDRLEAIKALDLSESGRHQVHQNRLLKLAREGSQMTAQHLRDLEPDRRYATLVAVMLETKATIIDQIVDLHDRMIGALFNRAKRAHAEQFQQSARAINEKLRLYWRIGEALLEAKRNGSDPFHAIEIVIPWDTFAQSVTEAQELSQAEGFDFLHRIVDGYSQIRRYAPAFLEALHFNAAPAAHEIAEGIEALKTLYIENARKVSSDAPVGFVRKRWLDLVFTDGGLDRRFYELCALAELKNALRSGDVWVQGSRQFRDFDEYLIPLEKFNALLHQGRLALAITTERERYLGERMLLLQQQLENVDRIAQANELPDAIITASGLRITPLANAVPDEAHILVHRAYALLPHVKITELLLEVDEWTGFTRHFTHLKSGDTGKDRILLLAVILADAINLGLAKMAESCPGSTYARLRGCSLGTFAMRPIRLRWPS